MIERIAFFIGGSVLLMCSDSVCLLAEENGALGLAGKTAQSAEVHEGAIQDAFKALVRVRVVEEGGQGKEGCGLIINGDGVILTNYHVIERAQRIFVYLYDEEQSGWDETKPYEAKVVRSSAAYDFALLDSPADTPHYFRFARDEDVRVGDEVKAIGNPYRLELSVSRGIISGIRTNKELPYHLVPGEQISQREFERITWIQTDTAMNPGNSGGPLLNAKNEVVGLNSFIYQGQGLNFALHVKHLRELAGHYYREPRGAEKLRRRTP